MKKDYKYIFELKELLWESLNKNFSEVKSEPWTMKDLENSIKKLKSNKSRDPPGFVNKLFKEGNMGNDLMNALLIFYNRLKDQMEIPEFVKDSDITSIFKHRGSKEDMNNQRGIFSLTTFKKVLDYLLYNEYYDRIDKSMTDSNIGGRKGRMAMDHLFVVYGIINNVVNENEEEIDIEIYDLEKAFDKLYLKDCLNELVEEIPIKNKNNKLSLLYKSNQKTNVSVKTPFGRTDRVTIEEIVQQGGVWGPILCSKSVDSHGTKCMRENKHQYIYKERTKVPPLT